MAKPSPPHLCNNPAIPRHPPDLESIVVHVCVAQHVQALRGAVNLVEQPVALVDVHAQLQVVVIVVVPAGRTKAVVGQKQKTYLSALVRLQVQLQVVVLVAVPVQAVQGSVVIKIDTF